MVYTHPIRNKKCIASHHRHLLQMWTLVVYHCDVDIGFQQPDVFVRSSRLLKWLGLVEQNEYRCQLEILEMQVVQEVGPRIPSRSVCKL